MKQKLTYLAALTLLVASCSSDDIGVDKTNTLSGDGNKTPISIQTNLSASPVTRAYDNTFEKDDALLAYIEAGTKDGDTFENGDNPFKGLKTFSITEKVEGSGTGTGEITSTDKLSPTIYWDDYSSTTYDLRSDNAGIRLKYGYCYNGGSAPADFDETAGTLTWTVKTNQSAAEGANMKKSDLLFASTQDMITYGHDADARGTLVLPYTHAMSKITITVKTDVGYDTETAHFGSAALTLKNMETSASVDAPKGEVAATSSATSVTDVTPYNSKKENTSATYQAIVAPTTFELGDVLASITNVDNNNYNIPVTPGIINAWSTEDRLIISDPEIIEDATAQVKTRSSELYPTTKFTTKPGVHYILDVTINKQAITLRATITDWDAVSAETTAKINFTPDVTEKGTIAEGLQANGFDVYKSSTNDAFSTKSTTLAYSSGAWTYSPIIYWRDQADNSFIRALSPASTTPSALSQGTDYMWGTSGAAAITPRTGDVPLEFEHAMSKITMQLTTATGDAAVDLTDAKIQISYLSTTGSINLVDGEITPDAVNEAGIANTAAPITNYCVIPQTISEKAFVTITLADGTTYKAQLKDCVETGTETAIDKWLRGKHYTYTIYLEKEKISFRALIKDWEEKTGSGNATLEWD